MALMVSPLAIATLHSAATAANPCETPRRKLDPESSSSSQVTELPTVVPSLIDELRRRINAEPASDKESTSMRMQELVGTRKLLSAIECLASSDR